MARTYPTSSGVPLPTWTRSSRARSLPTFRSSLAPRAHRVRIFVEPLLHRLEYVLVLPARDAALRAWRAAAFERAFPTDIGPIAVQRQPVFFARKTVCQFLTGRTAIDIFLRQIHEIFLAEATFRFRR